MKRSPRMKFATLLVSATILGACSSSSKDTTATTEAPVTETTAAAAAESTAAAVETTAAAAADTAAAETTAAPAAAKDVKLAGICPDPIVVQTDWLPESEHGEFYQLTGEGGVADTEKKRYVSPLYASGGVDTGVKIEIRAGGPAIGFQQSTAQLYSDSSILIAIVTMDQAIQNSVKLPTVGIIAPRRLSPQIIMWDPATYPDVKTIADLGKTDARVLYFGGAAYMDYLTGQGLLKKGQADGSYDGSPSTFVSTGGKVAQQGYATAEPFQYENEFKQWMKPVAYQLIADTGYNPFPSDAVKPESIKKYGDCFKKLVPILQQSEIDYLASPDRVNTLVSKLTDDFKGAAPYTKAAADFAVKVQLRDKIVGNNPDGTFGGFDFDGIAKLIADATPVFTAQGAPPVAGLTPQMLATNEFIDPSIKLP